MKRKQIWSALLTMVIAIGLLLNTENVYAASASVSVSPSAGTVTTGSTVSVTIGISADEPIGYGVAVSYNPAVLEYQGGGDGGGGGTVTILNEGDGGSASFSRTLTFKAIGTGSSGISTSAFAGGVFGYNSGDMATSYGSATVTVSAPQSSGGNGGNGGNTGGNSGDAPLTGSGDNALKSLQISPGTLNPTFSAGTTSYTVDLPEDTKSIVVSAVANDSKAKVAVSHNNDLEPGANKTYIVVTAENGTQRTYTLNVNCGEVEDTTEEQPDAVIDINGANYHFPTPEQMEGVAIPEGYTTAETAYEEQTITVYTSPNQKLQLVYLLDGDENGQWFIYNAETKTFEPYVEYRATANRYVILAPGADVVVPDGYAQTEVEIQGQKVTAYARADVTDLVLVYAMNINGEAGWYLYDTVEGTWQRYVIVEATVTEASTEEVSTAEVAVSADERVRNLRIILYVLCGVAVILLGVLIEISISFKKQLAEKVSGTDGRDADGIAEAGEEAEVIEDPDEADETLEKAETDVQTESDSEEMKPEE